jgi:hypothetical protein
VALQQTEKDTKEVHECKCLSQGFYSCTNIMTKKQAGEERVYAAYTSILLFITKRSQDWNSSRSENRSWCRSHGGIFFTGLLPLAFSACSLIEPRLSAQRWNHPQRDLPPWWLIEKMPYSWISWRHFPNWSSFLCDNSSLCQVDTKLASTAGKPKHTLLNETLRREYKWLLYVYLHLKVFIKVTFFQVGKVIFSGIHSPGYT